MSQQSLRFIQRWASNKRDGIRVASPVYVFEISVDASPDPGRRRVMAVGIHPILIRRCESLFGPKPEIIPDRIVDQCLECTVNANIENVGGDLTLADLWSCLYPPVIADRCKSCGRSMRRPEPGVGGE